MCVRMREASKANDKTVAGCVGFLNDEGMKALVFSSSMLVFADVVVCSIYFLREISRC
jgi:hypothetical protein